MFKTIISLTSMLLIVSACVTTQAVAVTDTEKGFASYMAKEHGFNKREITRLLNKAEHKQSIINAMTRPAEGKPWHEYRKIFLRDNRINQGVTFYNKHLALLQRAEKELDVDPFIITAIIGVETMYGGNTGSYRVIDALKTLGFGYPKRANFFRKQLEEFFLMCREEGIDPLQPMGSYAGAMGMPQFIPSSFRSWAIDFDGDNKRDLWNNPADIIGSVANYFVAHGWIKDAPVARKLSVAPKGLEVGSRRGQKPNISRQQLASSGIKLKSNEAGVEMASLIELQQPDNKDYWLGFNNFYVITRYNHSNLYAMAVYQLSEAIRTAAKQ